MANCRLLLAVAAIVVVGCSAGRDRAIPTPSEPERSSPEAEARRARLEEMNALTAAFVNSLSEEQIAEANHLAVVDYPDDSPYHMEPGKGLAYGELNLSQQASLERLWELHLEEASAPPRAPWPLEAPGPIESAEVYNVQYAEEDHPEMGPVLIVSFYAGRPPQATIFSWRGRPGEVELSPALEHKGLDAVARNGVRATTPEGRARVLAKEQETGVAP